MKLRYNCYLIDKEREWPWREWPLILYDKENDTPSFDVAKVETMDPLMLKIPASKKDAIRHDFSYEEAREIEAYYKQQNPDFDVKITKIYINSF
jgi:hypothetical protein